MKKLLALMMSAAIIFAGATPSNADIYYYDTMSGWNQPLATSASLSVGGSIKAGAYYTISLSGQCPDGSAPTAGSIYLLSNPATLLASSFSSPLQVSTAQIQGYGAGSWENYGGIIYCSTGIYKTQFVHINFERVVGTPANFSVFPQAAGTAFTTWGIADGATSYVVTATPGNQTCTTSNNYCVVTGLTPGATYEFSVVAKNGNSSGTAVSSGPVLLREPVSVAVVLQSANWRVGETATAQYTLQGSNATPTITWYRCTNMVPTMPSPPPPGECNSVGSGSNYTLTAADVGRFVTANVFVNTTDPQGQMTANSTTAVLSSGAVTPEPVADPAGKPTIVNIPNPIVSVAGGTEVTITGTGLAGVTSVTIGGVPAIVVSKTDTTVVVQVPVATKLGLADLTVTNDKGSVTSKSAIVYTTNPVIKVTKTSTLTGFTSSAKTLTAAQKSKVKALLTANPTLTELTCAAKTTGVKSSKAELAKATTLAKASCAYAKSLKPTLVTKTSAAQTLPKSKASRTVLLTLKN